MDRVWVAFGPKPANERIAADTAGDRPPVAGARVRVLQRRPGDEPAAWMLLHQPGRSGRGRPGRESTGCASRRAGRRSAPSGRSETGRSAAGPSPDPAACRRSRPDRPGGRTRPHCGRGSGSRDSPPEDALKTSLLQSVSHDFRTPLAVIRAAAGSLDSDSALSPEDRHANTQAIEREVEYLNALVANLLDMSRIEAGVLRPDGSSTTSTMRVTQAIARLRPRLGGRRLELEIGPRRRAGRCGLPRRGRGERAGQRDQVHAGGRPASAWRRRSRTAPRCA